MTFIATTLLLMKWVTIYCQIVSNHAIIHIIILFLHIIVIKIPLMGISTYDIIGTCTIVHINMHRRYKMARPKKVVLTPEEELEKLTADIEAVKENLKELEKQKKELEVQIKMDRLAAIDEMISASGKSLDEVKALLSK